jgi:hypothetical protein
MSLTARTPMMLAGNKPVQVVRVHHTSNHFVWWIGDEPAGATRRT